LKRPAYTPKTRLISSTIFDFGGPARRETSLPPLKKTIAGIAMMPSVEAVSGLMSTFIATTSTLPEYSFEICSSTGAMARQPPHHSAQKSTMVGRAFLRTLESNVASVVSARELIPSFSGKAES